jgi:hypothetical protein
MIVFEPLAGLCNRMRSLDSALHLADQLDRKLHVIWDRNKELNCRLEELFEMPQGIASIDQPSMGRYGRQFRWALYTCTYPINFGQKRVKQWIDEKRDFAALGKFSRIAMATWEEFYPRRHPYRAFAPIARLQSQIERYGRDEMVAVHIRRSDHRIAITESPTERFIELMQLEIDADRRTNFFLATDSPEVESQLLQRFPKRIVTHAKSSLARNQKCAIEDALVDLYVLSNCRKLIGSRWSSFTNTAAAIRGIEKIVAVREGKVGEVGRKAA